MEGEKVFSPYLTVLTLMEPTGHAEADSAVRV